MHYEDRVQQSTILSVVIGMTVLMLIVALARGGLDAFDKPIKHFYD